MKLIRTYIMSVSTMCVHLFVDRFEYFYEQFYLHKIFFYENDTALKRRSQHEFQEKCPTWMMSAPLAGFSSISA
jgi:hypothetical protein